MNVCIIAFTSVYIFKLLVYLLLFGKIADQAIISS